MMRSGEEESQRPEQGDQRRPNLPFTITPEIRDRTVRIINSDSVEKKKIVIPPETPTKHEKPKAMNFPISKITIGGWTRTAVFPDDLKAKFYFAKRKLMWESLDDLILGTETVRRKRKIEFCWTDVASIRPAYHTHDGTGRLEVELRNRPTFYMETNPKAGKHTQWRQIEDFTPNQDASMFRRHTLYFDGGVLQKNFEKLSSSDNFWSTLIKADNFPSLGDSLYFDFAYGNNNNASHYNQGQTLSFDANNSLLQGFGHVGVGVEHGNVNLESQFFGNDGMPMNPFVQDNFQQSNIPNNQILATQGIQPFSQMMDSFGPQFVNPMIQHQSQTVNTSELVTNEVYVQGLLEMQATPNTIPQPNETYGPFLQRILEEETYLSGSDYIDYNQYINHDGSMPPSLL